MMGRLNHDQGQLFYSFCLDEAVPDDHLVRQIAGVLDHFAIGLTEIAQEMSAGGGRIEFGRARPVRSELHELEVLGAGSLAPFLELIGSEARRCPGILRLG